MHTLRVPSSGSAGTAAPWLRSPRCIFFPFLSLGVVSLGWEQKEPFPLGNCPAGFVSLAGKLVPENRVFIWENAAGGGGGPGLVVEDAMSPLFPSLSWVFLKLLRTGKLGGGRGHQLAQG